MNLHRYLFIGLLVLQISEAFSQFAKEDPIAIWQARAASASHSSPDSALFYVLEGLSAIESTDYDRVGSFIKIPIYLNAGDSFTEFVERQLKEYPDPVSTANIYLTHQRMRYYVSVEADFDRAFRCCVELRQQLENKTDHLLFPSIMADVYYISYWIKHVQHDLKKSRGYAELLLKHAIKFDQKSTILTAKMGMAELNQHEGNISEAIDQFLELETELLELNDSININRLYLLLSNAYVANNDQKTALHYGYLGYRHIPALNRSLRSFNTIHIARGLLDLGQVDSAIIWTEDALKVAVGLGLKKEQTDLHEMLANAYKADENFEKALYHVEKKLEMETEQASLLSAANISNLESELEEQRHNITVREKELDIERKDAVISKDKAVKIALCAFLVLTILIIFVAVRSYLNKKKDAAIIRIQRDIVKERNTEILDSINYAKRIQAAILPTYKIVKEYLENSFVLYKPKDIVAGDFYWIEHRDNKILFAAADCTGHGVPGAMISVICNNGLNRAVREFGLTEPGKILDKTREIIIQEFEKSEEEVRDGMDIALCSLEGKKLRYAGANNSLWIARKGAEEILEIRADKQPIGKYETQIPYTTHDIDLEAGDTIYIFSDGYADQFGGAKGKKFKAANFKKLLISVQNESMERQREIIDETFENWKGSIEQLDDVCVIGVRI